MGSSRNSPSKAERRLDRKQRREAANRQDHRDKEKAREKEIKEENKDKPKKQTAWKRRDKNGNIVLWNAIKISKTSGYVLGGMAAIATGLAVHHCKVLVYWYVLNVFLIAVYVPS